MLNHRLPSLFRDWACCSQNPGCKSFIARQCLVNLAEQCPIAQGRGVAIFFAFQTEPSSLLSRCACICIVLAAFFDN